jgi:uncharacterized membrane protein YraQ (UPF0718 family)
MKMKDFITNISSLYWWISVVIVGILINLSSAYLKNKLDSSFYSASSWWRERSVAQKSKRRKELEELKGNHHKQLLLAFGELRDRMRSLLFFLFSFAVFGITIFLKSTSLNNQASHQTIFEILLMASGSVCSLLGIGMFAKATRKLSLLYHAYQAEESQEN